MVDIKRLQELHAKATPVPWAHTRPTEPDVSDDDVRVCYLSDGTHCEWCIALAGETIDGKGEKWTQETLDRWHADADLIAETRNALPDLLARDLSRFFDSKAKWSLETFGPGDRYAGVCKHIRKELAEIEAKPSDLEEWVDVVLLAMDGAWRSAGADGQTFVEALLAKDRKNRARSWPDWRTLAPGAVSEHVRSVEPSNPADSKRG